MALDVHAPVRIYVPKKKKNICLWMNAEIRSVRKERDSTFREWKKGGDVSIKNKYKSFRNKLKFLVKNARDNYNAGRLVGITDQKTVWRELRHLGILRSIFLLMKLMLIFYLYAVTHLSM